MLPVSTFVVWGQVASNGTAEADPDYFNQPVVFRKLPEGRELLRQVRARLPAVPLIIQADIKTLVKDAPDHLMKAEVELHWETARPRARYTLMDGFGARLEQLEVSWFLTGSSRYQHLAGEASTASETFNLYAPIQSVPLTWFDITLPFLWWPGGETAGVDRRKGRECYMVDIPAPAWEKSPYARIRVWVDAREYLILHAEGYGPDDRLAKTIKIQSIKKINEVWMIKDLEVIDAGTGTRTKIRVTELKELAPAQPAAPVEEQERLPPLLSRPEL